MSELDQYDYDLPRSLIAQEPLPRRADARLMVVDRKAGTITHRQVRDLPELLKAGDCLTLNDTRVVPARLSGIRALTGGRWEGLFLREDEEGHWRLLAKTRGKVAPGELITLLDLRARPGVALRMIEKLPGGVWVAHPEADDETLPLLERFGRVPLPCYIRNGAMTPTDRQRYQTVYARTPGAVAAPTAGLHFSQELLATLVDQGVNICRVTLHIGLDTFRPISVDSLDEHPMHKEWGRIEQPIVDQLLRCRTEGGRIVAVGTTSVRVLETAAAAGELTAWSGQTQLFIRPPYKFKAVDALLTNFHLPRSTLLILVRTFGGDELMRQAYDEAVREQYRFYSYGDAMLIV